MSNNKLKLDELNRFTIEEFKQNQKHPVVVVLDNVRSLNNVGSFFRTCDAFNVETLVLTGITATPPHREIQKTALGATQTVHWIYENSSIDIVKKFKNEGYHICSIEQAEKTTLLQDFKIVKNKKTVFIFGNEVDGVDQSIIEISDEVLEIPQFGTKHSLNVAVTGGAVLWEVTKQLIS